MKTMTLTGLSQETNFGVPGKEGFGIPGESSFFLVFNDGELRIPVPEETVQFVIQYVYGGQEEQHVSYSEAEVSVGDYSQHDDDDVVDEDGVDQV